MSGSQKHGQKPPGRKRARYTAEFRTEALKLAKLRGVAEAARELGLEPNLLYTWRRVQQSDESRSALEREQAAEIARLKRELGIRPVSTVIDGAIEI